jgi:hypothetical protein
MKTIKFELSISDGCLQPEFHQEKVCKVVKRELNERIYCYDLNFLFFLQYPKYCCHRKWFSALDEKFIKRISINLLIELQLIIMDKIIMVYFYIFINDNFCRLKGLYYTLFLNI